MARTFRILVDTLGSETNAQQIVKGSIEFSRRYPDCQLAFIGRQSDLASAGAKHFETYICNDFVDQRESLVSVLRSDRRPSMKLALEKIANGEFEGMVSSGNTGALMALSRQTLQMLPGIDRPAIIKGFRGKVSPFWMLDLGANIVRKESLLIQFAHMGSAYAESIGQQSHPRVALLNIGAEAHKGPQLIRSTAEVLADDQSINFVGFIEADRIFDGIAEVVVADGYAGNIALKAIEGAAGLAHAFIRSALVSADLETSALALEVANSVVSQLNTQTYNGASFVGLDGVVIKSHGRTDEIGICAALEQAREEISANVPVRVRSQYSKFNSGV